MKREAFLVVINGHLDWNSKLRAGMNNVVVKGCHRDRGLQVRE